MTIHPTGYILCSHQLPLLLVAEYTALTIVSAHTAPCFYRHINTRGKRFFQIQNFQANW